MIDQRYSFFYAGDAFPAGSSPFLSGYPGPSPLTSDPPYRSANSSSLQMAQLWASHAHDGKPPYASAKHFHFSLSFCLGRMSYILKDTGGIIFLFVTTSSCPKPRRLVPFLFIASTNGILFHFCPPAAGCALGSVLYASHFPCPPPVFDSRLSYITVIYPPSLVLFKAFCPICTLSLANSMIQLVHDIFFSPMSSRNIYLYICVCVLSSQSLCSGLFTE